MRNLVTLTGRLFSSPVGVFFLFIDNYRLADNDSLKVFVPCRGILLIYLLTLNFGDLLMLVFVPCRGILLIYKFKDGVIKKRMVQFSSPVGVFFLFIKEVELCLQFYFYWVFVPCRGILLIYFH